MCTNANTKGAEGRVEKIARKHFDVHAGRNAFRHVSDKAREMSKDLNAMDLDELRRQQYAIRSFTESVDDDDLDWPLPPKKLEEGKGPTRDGREEEEDDKQEEEENDERMKMNNGREEEKEEEEEEEEEDEGTRSASRQHSECGTMHESSTTDTIVEVQVQVLSPNFASTSKSGGPQLDPCMGETQKYVMRVSGPELVEQEFELHKSLVNNTTAEEEDIAEAEAEVDGDVGQHNFKNFCAKESAPNSRREEMRPHAESCSVSSPSPSNSHFAPRPRPTTPTGLSFLRIESFSAELATEKASSSVAVSSRMPPDSFTPKMHVVIPVRRGGSKLNDSQRRFSTGQRDICNRNAIGGEVPAQNRIRCGSTAAWSYVPDIIESNPEYAGKAPPTPVEHRRSSREWQSFDDGEDETEKVVGNGDASEGDREFVKALEEVRNLIEEVEQKLHQEEEEEEAEHTATKASSTLKDNRKLSGSSYISKLFPMASSSGVQEAGDGQMTRVPVRAAPPPPPATTNFMQNVETKLTYTSHQPNLDEFVTDQPPLIEAHRRMDNGIDGYPTDPMPANPFTTAEIVGEKNPFGTTEEQTNEQPNEQQQQQQQKQQQQQQQHCEQYGDYSGYAYDQQQQYSFTTYDTGNNYDNQQQQQQNRSYAQMDYCSERYGSDYSSASAVHSAEWQNVASSAYQEYGIPEVGGNLPHGLHGNVQYDDVQTAQKYGEEFCAPGAAEEFAESGHTDNIEYAGLTSEQPPTNGQQDYAQYDAAVAEQPADTTDYSQYGAPPAGNPFVVVEEPPLNTSVYGIPPSEPPTVSFLAQPMFPAQRARTPDPFSWEAQESAYREHGTAVVPKRPPVSPRTPETDSERLEEQEEAVTEEAQKDDLVEAKKSPPPRPNAPPPCRPPAPSPARPPAPPSPRPARKAEPKQQEQQQQQQHKKKEEVQEEEEEEDAWKRFQKMTDRMGAAMKSTEQRLGELDKDSAAMTVPDDALVQEYLAHTGGGTQLNAAQRQQIAEQEAERKRQKQEKKRKKLEKGFGQFGAAIGERVGALKRAPSPPADPKAELDLEKAATDLANKIAAQHGFKLENAGGDNEEEEVEEEALAPEKTGTDDEKGGKGEDERNAEENEAVDEEETKAEQKLEGAGEEGDNKFEADFSKLDAENPAKRWAAALEEAALMPPSDSDVNLAQKLNTGGPTDPFDTRAALEGTVDETTDPFAPMPTDASFDPFEVIPVEELIAKARQKAELERAKREAEHEGDFLAESRIARLGDHLSASHHSSPTPEGGSPVSSVARPVGFDDDFKGTVTDDESPLFDVDDSQPLPVFPLSFTGDGWELFLRYPPKKKLMADRFWKPIYVRIRGNMLAMFTNKEELRPAQEILIQANYSLSDIVLQPYDVYGKIHTVKLQHILYKERVGIRPGQISRLVEGHLTKYGLPLEHAAQCTVLAKFGSQNEQTIGSFTDALEDVLFRCPAKRETMPTYRQDEVQIHCYDEYEAKVDKDGNVSDQLARVRLFCLSFLSGSPFLEIGLNDRRREGKEVVRRKDILPMYTERWIRFEAPEFHETVDKTVWEDDQVLRIQPPDGCFFELMRFRVRPPRNRERPLNVKCVMRVAGSHVELRIDAMAVAHQQRARGTAASTRTIPCEDIAVRFPLPEAWIYLFREQRTWGVGSVHSKQRKPGKVKNLRDKLMGTVQHSESCLIEVGIGEAKYEHLYRSLVWRIPRLPERENAVYKSYILKCRFELSSFDLMPEQFAPCGVVEFTMPLAVISNTVVRSVGVEQHEDSESVEKFVRNVAKCKYSLEIDYQQCSDLDSELANTATAIEEPAEPSRHLAAFDPKDVQSRHDGYRIELPDDRMSSSKMDENGGGDHDQKTRKSSSSSSDEDDSRRAFPVVQIDMKGYGY